MTNNTKKRILLTAALFLMAIVTLVSCGKGKNKKDYLPLVKNSQSAIVIVRPNESTDVEKEIAQNLKNKLTSLLNTEVPITVDKGFDESNYSEGAYVVCVGKTSFSQTEKFLSKQKDEGFGVKLSKNVIVVAATNDIYLELAADEFMKSVVEDGGAYYLDKDKLDFTSGKLETTTIVSNKSTDYKIVCEDTTESTSKETHYSVLLASRIVDAFKKNFGAEIALQDDNLSPEGKEIIIGACPRRKSATAIAKELSYNDYSITIDKDGNVFICGKNYENTSLAVDKFVEIANSQAKSKDFKLANVFSRNYSINEMPTVPLYEDSKDFKLISSVENRYALYYNQTTVEKYENYLEKLEKSGYELVARNEISDNIFATYQNSDSIVNCYYTARNFTVRVCVDSKETTKLYNYEPQNVDAITTPMLIQYTSGCAYLIRLEDGTFIVYDGGMPYEEIRDNLYNSLKQYNVTGQTPVIRAWMFSHPHEDHLGGFFKFAEKFSGKVDLQQIVFNFPTRTHYYATIDDAPTGATILETRIEKFLTYCKKYYPKADIVTGHTGQIMYFGNTKVEILHTHEDDFPGHIEKGNQISMVARFNIAGQKILLTGDLYTTSSDIIVDMFGDHLKSDIVQIPHHGYAGGTVGLYNHVQAEMCMFPTPVSEYLKVKDKSYNAAAIKIAKQVLVLNGKKDMMVLNLPYQSAEGEKWNQKK